MNKEQVDCYRPPPQQPNFSLVLTRPSKSLKHSPLDFYFPFLYKKNCSLHFKKWLGLNRATRQHYSFTSFCVYLIIRMTNLTPCYQLRSHQQIHLNIYRHKLMSHLLESILCITVILWPNQSQWDFQNRIFLVN